jgi:hypothetical protein
MNTLRLLALVTPVALAACTGMPMGGGSMGAAVDNAMLPEAVRVPAGEKQKLWTVGIGEITYECRAKKDTAGAHEWAFVGPKAVLKDASGKQIGTYYGGPTWESADGSKVTGKQVAVAPNKPGSIALQLVKADPAMGMGAMQGTSYIQRLKTEGGVPPSAACGMANMGEKQVVAYQADYVFYGR